MSRFRTLLVSLFVAVLAIGAFVPRSPAEARASESSSPCNSTRVSNLVELTDAGASLAEPRNPTTCISEFSADNAATASTASGEGQLKYDGRGAGEDCWAIIIGVSLYQYGSNLTYCDDDARALHDTLSPVWGDNHTKLLLNSQATKANIQNAISTWLDPLEDEDDTVLFYFSGHGSQAGFDRSPYDESDGEDETICPYDTSSYSWTYDVFDDELESWLGNLEAGKQVVILDSCFSGGFITKSGSHRPTGNARDAADGFTRDLSRSGRAILSACAENESSWERAALGHGVFTYYLLNAFHHLKAADANGDDAFSAEELFSYAQPRTTNYESTQHPQIYDGYAGELDLFALVALSVDASPEVSSVSLDGEEYSANDLPISEKVIIGTGHDLSVPAYVDTGIQQPRYAFTTWNDGATASSRTVTITQSSSFTASYKTQYYLELQSAHGNPQGAGWYDDGSAAQFSVDSTADQGDGTRYLFAGWSGSSSVTDRESSIVMDSPKSIATLWNEQCYLTVESAHGNPQGAGWYDKGSTAQFSVDSPVDQGDGTRYLFDGWSGDSSATEETSSTAMDSPRTITALWSQQFKLTVNTNSSGAEVVAAETWHDKGTTASTETAESVIQGDPGVRYVFSSWSVDGRLVSGNPVSLRMKAPHTVLADYSVQYELTVLSDKGAPEGSGWYEAGSTADIAVTSPGGGLIRQVFAGWNGDYSSPQRETTVLMDGPKTIKAQWRADFMYLGLLIGAILAFASLVAIAIILFRRRYNLRDLPDYFSDRAGF